LDFESFGFDPKVLDGILALGYKTPTPVQEKAIPVILAGKDIIASAQTGTGKTAAFLLPMIQRITQVQHDGHIRALVVVPTRELAIQIDQQMEGLSYFTKVSSIAVYGGSDGATFSREKQALQSGAEVVICTPGRMMAHLNLGYVNMEGLQFLVLDEADRMLDMGFHEDIMKIISYLPAQRQNLLFSATMPPKMRELARKILVDPEEITIALSKPPERIVQAAYIVYDQQKIELVKYILTSRKLRSVIVFCSTKVSARQLTRELKRTELVVEEIHSDLDQDSRKKVLNSFRNREVNVLVATDVLSRGIDIDDIDLVINFDVPHDAEDYIHRIGRTARVAARGVAITFVNESEQRKFASIEHLLGHPVPKVRLPEHLGEGPAYQPGSARKGPAKSFRRKKQ
jgi:ATP-dependent RNA helicase RhlE